MAPHSSTLAWKIPWMAEPGRLQYVGSLKVRHDWATSLSCIGEGNDNPLQCSCLENPRDGGAWLDFVYGVTQSRTRLKWLRSSSSHFFCSLNNRLHLWNSTVWKCFHMNYFSWPSLQTILFRLSNKYSKPISCLLKERFEKLAQEIWNTAERQMGIFPSFLL